MKQEQNKSICEDCLFFETVYCPYEGAAYDDEVCFEFFDFTDYRKETE